jgi:hypothetical protein
MNIGRNERCPCGSGKKYKMCCIDKVIIAPPSYSWTDSDGIHLLQPGEPPSPQELAEMTAKFQQEVKNSPMWKEMLSMFGEEKANELLSGINAELK